MSYRYARVKRVDPNAHLFAVVEATTRRWLLSLLKPTAANTTLTHPYEKTFGSTIVAVRAPKQNHQPAPPHAFQISACRISRSACAISLLVTGFISIYKTFAKSLTKVFVALRMYSASSIVYVCFECMVGFRQASPGARRADSCHTRVERSP